MFFLVSLSRKYLPLTALLIIAITCSSFSSAQNISSNKLDAFVNANKINRSNITEQTTAFYYGSPLPVFELSHFDEIVVQPKNCTKKELAQVQGNGSEIFAYLSVGEISNRDVEAHDLPENWFHGRNTTWQSNVVDLRNPLWREWLLNKQITPLINQGYNGLFLDTLDSYQLVAKTPIEQQQQRDALISLIHSIKKQHPDIKLNLNRGFELLPALKGLVHAVSAESLLQAWNEKSKQYYTVNSKDHQWLLSKLQEVKELGIPVKVLDYVDPSMPELAIETANQITALGFTPWVSVAAQNIIGHGAVTIIPRRLLVIYDSSFSSLDYHPAHITLGSAFDYLGLRVEYHDIQKGIPTVDTANSYAGIVSYLSYASFEHITKLENWLLAQKERHTPIVFYEDLPFVNKTFIDAFGIGVQNNVKKPLTIISSEQGIGDYEVPVNAKKPLSKAVYSKNKKHKVLLKLADSNEKEIDPILIAEWGGLALAPFTKIELNPGSESWVIDPVEFFRKALKIELLPVADATTENGNRILTSHIDGDGFASKAELPGNPYSGEVILDEILKVYKIPHTVSVIEGEISKQGLYPHLSDTLEKIAKRIFSLSYIEAASHSFSHPFVWQPDKYPEKISDTYGISLKIPDYTVDIEREILGSIDYINNNLLPQGKKVKAFLWTGDALPGKEALALVEKAGVKNINGASTKLTNAYSSTTKIYPQSRMTEGRLQVYAPIMNENIYSNDWEGPFYGFNKVVETIKLTGEPRRYKPISIYWHFYSGTKLAALMALHDTYRWALKLPHTALPISEYSAKVEGAYSASFAKRANGSIVVNSLGSLRTIRVSNNLGFPDVANSKGIAGFIDTDEGRYLHLSQQKADIRFTKEDKNETILQTANAILYYWKYTDKGVEMRLKGYEPLTFTIHSNNQCILKTNGTQISGKKINGVNRFQLKTRDTEDALLVC